VRTVRRVGLLAVLLGVLLAGSACGRHAAADPGDDVVRPWPAAVAGGACQLLEFDSIARQIGTRFDTAGAGQRGETYTCALTIAGTAYPDLTLAVTASDADEVVFTATVVPSNSAPVKNLGRVAYQLRVPAAGKAGPAVEIGWLSGNQRIMVLRYTLPPNTPAATVDALAAKFSELARIVDLASV
jgi:hypothetical protein